MIGAGDVPVDQADARAHGHVDHRSEDPFADVAIVVPVGPGDTSWPPLLESLRRDAASAQLLPVFADGDPQPGPVDALCAPAGRAMQQNAGAAAATRRWLWFLHADSRIDAQVLDGARHWLSRHGDRNERVMGWCRLAFADDGPALMRLNAAGANWRARALGLPFGDQGLLLRAEDFAALGGFDPSLLYGEDHALVWRARRADIPLHAIDATLVTSARKYARGGWLRTTLYHLRLTAAQAWDESQR